MHLAALKGYDYIFDILIKYNADIGAKDANGRSVLHFCCCGNSTNILNMIIGLNQDLLNEIDNY